MGPGAGTSGRVVHVHDVWADVVGGGVGKGKHAGLRRHRSVNGGERTSGTLILDHPQIRKSVRIRS